MLELLRKARAIFAYRALPAAAKRNTEEPSAIGLAQFHRSPHDIIVALHEAQQPVTYNLDEFTLIRANAIVAFNGLQRLLSSPLEKSHIGNIVLDASNGVRPLAEELTDNWLQQLSSRLGRYWKFALPCPATRLPPAVIRGAIAAIYRCPVVSPLSVQDLVSHSISLKCHLCGHRLTVDLELPDVGNNGVCHAQRCVRQNFITRHNAVGRCLAGLVRSSGLPAPCGETTIAAIYRANDVQLHLSEDDRLSQDRPDFLVITAGESHAYDQAIISCSRSSNIATALQEKSNSKRLHYEDVFNRIGFGFHPIVFTALGSVDIEFDNFVHKYRKIAEDNKKKLSLKWFYSRLSVILAYYLGTYVARSYHGISL